MVINVRLGDPLWRSVGQRRLALTWPADDPPTVAAVLAYLSQTYADFSSALADAGLSHAYPYRYFIDARLVPPEDHAARRLQEGETLYIFLPAAGGSGQMTPLPRAFYARETVAVAQDMLGCFLVRELADGSRVCGRIVETEAYGGPEDLASHAARGPTPRAALMFGEPGYAYVYFIYGMYHCLNAVTETHGTPGAVLIRALEPLSGIAVMQQQYPRPRRDVDLTNGPGKLCRALQIDRSLNGHDLVHSRALYLTAGSPPASDTIAATPRIGVRADERGLTLPWRFVISGHPSLSTSR